MKKILIVEDEKLLAEMYYDKLSQSGFKARLAGSAEDALRLVKEEKPDLIILDVLLPKKNGLFFLENIRKDSKLSSIPVVVFSNYDDADARKQAESLDVEDYLIKTSYTPQQIIDKIKTYFK